MKIKKIVSIMLVVCLCFGLVACNGKDENKEEPTPVAETESTLNMEETYTINMYCSDKGAWEYLTVAIAKFNEAYPNVTVKLNYEVATGYIESLVKHNTDSAAIADLYIMNLEDMEKAYLAGITTENTFPEYTVENYATRSLAACTYKEKLLAYPLSFSTQVMVCNTDYNTAIPATFDEMKEISNTIEVGEGQMLENVFTWDLSDMYLNYNFIGDAISVCGINGDDPYKIDINNDEAVAALTNLKGLTTFYNITRADVTSEKVITSFAEGKTVFALVNSDDLRAIEEKNTEGTLNYKILDIPDVNENTESVGLSSTKGIVVNPYSKNMEVAQLVAKYLTYDTADMIYEKTGDFSARLLDTSDTYKYKGAYDAYEHTTLKVRLMDVSDFYIKLDIALHNIIDGGDIPTELEGLETYLKTTFNKQ